MNVKKVIKRRIPVDTPNILKAYIKATRKDNQDVINEASKQLREYILEKVDVALEELYENDIVLLKNEMYEVTVCGRLAMYLQKQFEDFIGFHIDIEYYRLKKPRDSANLQSDRIRCDLLLHSRQWYENRVDNLLAIEVKLSKNLDDGKSDRSRLAEFVVPEKSDTPKNAIHSTLLGLFIRLDEKGYYKGIFTSVNYQKMLTNRVSSAINEKLR